MRVIQGCEDLRLAREAGDAARVMSQRRGKYLDSDLSTKLDVPRPIHVAHAAGPDARADFVLAQTSSDERAGCRQACVGGIGRRLLEEVFGGGLIEQRLDFAFERLFARAGIIEKRASPIRGQRQRRVKEAFDVQPVLSVHYVVASGLQGVTGTRPWENGYPIAANGVRNPL